MGYYFFPRDSSIYPIPCIARPFLHLFAMNGETFIWLYDIVTYIKDDVVNINEGIKCMIK